ncbi:response regulator [Aequorivita antarctica]|uniref:Response regulator n=1 Tax=Aequorivita antarctica TaxID=153266 RepID=A0A5C6Z092_9FLAO|nr:response regulator [Aequorivita antarctica]TXD72920.1 response regulator [Aequorivita antarctica]SRX74673.1 Response regulator ArlR [Aequorivita antarctica]
MNKILIVEDDHNLGIMIQDMLGFSGYDVMLSRKPNDTNENIIEHNIKLVLLDKLIFGVDGTDVCAKIRRQGSISRTPVLMMSALNNAREICMKAGASDFISKPFDMSDLISKIEHLLHKDESLQ